MKKLNHVLLIEDNDFINIYNRRIIEQLGIRPRIEIATDGQEGLDFLEQTTQVPDETPDLILLDLNMPRLNGWEFIDAYSAIKPRLNKQIVIIVLSTSPNPDDLKRAEKIEDIAAFVSKPLTREVLGRLIQKYFPVKGTE